MSYFLVEFDRKKPPPAKVTRFEESAPAMAALSERERNRLPEVEVVLLFADSIEQLKRSHSRYFLTLREEIEQMRRDLGITPEPAGR